MLSVLAEELELLSAISESNGHCFSNASQCGVVCALCGVLNQDGA